MSDDSSIRCRDDGHGRWRSIFRCLKTDTMRYLTKSPENVAAGVTFKSVTSALLTNQLQCMVLYRLSHLLYLRGHRWSALLLSRLNYYIHKVSLPPETCLGAGCFIPHPVGVFFCASAGEGLTLYHLAVACAAAEGGREHSGAWLGDRVVIGGRAVLLGPVRVGDDAKVFAVHIRSDVPSGTLAVCGRSRQRMTLHATKECSS